MVQWVKRKNSSSSYIRSSSTFCLKIILDSLLSAERSILNTWRKKDLKAWSFNTFSISIFITDMKMSSIFAKKVWWVLSKLLVNLLMFKILKIMLISWYWIPFPSFSIKPTWQKLYCLFWLFKIFMSERVKKWSRQREIMMSTFSKTKYSRIYWTLLSPKRSHLQIWQNTTQRTFWFSILHMTKREFFTKNLKSNWLRRICTVSPFTIGK